MSTRIIAFLALSSMAVIALAAGGNVQIRHVALTSTSVISGGAMFTEYCAVCHGPTGKGDGPAAAALSRQPANLTLLTKRNGGTFPEMLVMATLLGKETYAHGTQSMPEWARLFKSLSRDNPNLVQLRMVNLVSYVKTLQVQ